MEDRSSGETSGAQRIAELRARVGAGERDAAGPLGELLAGRGDLRGAIQVWVDAYGDSAPGTKRLAELLVQEGELEDAVRAWEDSDPVWNNPISVYRQRLASLPEEERREFEYDEPEEMTGSWIAVLAELLAQQGEAAVIARVRARETEPVGERGTGRDHRVDGVRSSC